MEKEKLSHTFFDDEFALPHCHLRSHYTYPIGIVGYLKKGESINWSKTPNTFLPVKTVLLLVLPLDKPNTHINVIKKIIKKIINNSSHTK